MDAEELQRRLDIVQVEMQRLGVTAEDLRKSARRHPVPAPTVAEYASVVAAAATSGTRRVYEPYWCKAVERWGGRRLDDITAADVITFAEHCRDTAVQRRSTRTGNSAAEHAIAALRCLYRHAAADGVIAADCNPALEVPKPRRMSAATGRILTDSELTAIIAVVSSTGNDPELDGLVLRLHQQTACTRAEVVNLSTVDLDERRSLILVRAGLADQRTQPVSPSLTAALRQHSRQRSGPTSALLRYRDGRPLTSRRYDHLWQRSSIHLPWIAAERVSTGSLRAATLDRVTRRFGASVARAFVSSDVDRAAAAGRRLAELAEIAAVVAELNGEPHPLAEGARMPWLEWEAR